MNANRHYFVETRHTHPPDAAEVEVVKIVAKMKKTAVKYKSDSSRKIVTGSVASISEAASAVLPNVSALCRTVNRARAEAVPRLPTPASREDLVLRDIFTVTTKGDQFSLHDSGGKDRFLIFTTERNLRYLSSCQLWLCDGTFSIVPSIFSQLYTLHGAKIDESNPQNLKALPLMYVFTPNRKCRTYTAMLNVLKEAEPSLNPDIMMIDSEMPFLKAFSHCFPDADIKGCHFHYG